MVLELPRPLLSVVLGFLDHRSVHQLELAGADARGRVHASGHWRAYALERVVLDGGGPLLEGGPPGQAAADGAMEAAGDDLAQLWRRWKRLACLASGTPQRREQSLLVNVHGCSSYDRPCESPANTLLPSRCWQSIQKLQTRAPFDAHHFDNDQGSASEALRCMAESAQVECGCNASPSSCCYWSSMPSPTPFTEDFIEYAAHDNCLVQRVQVVPYRAFRLPGSPAFAAERVSFHLFRREGRDVVPVYCSPLYAMKNDMTLQEFELPRSVLLSRGGLIRVNLFGRYQRETIQLPPWIHQDEHYLHHNLLHYHNPEDPADPTESPQYYICLSYVNAVGVANAL